MLWLPLVVKLHVAHAPGMPWTFSPSPRVSDPDMHHGTCVMHVPWCQLGSLISGLFWSRRRGKRFRNSRRKRSQQFCVSGMRPIVMSHIAAGGSYTYHVCFTHYCFRDVTRIPMKSLKCSRICMIISLMYIMYECDFSVSKYHMHG